MFKLSRRAKELFRENFKATAAGIAKLVDKNGPELVQKIMKSRLYKKAEKISKSEEFKLALPIIKQLTGIKNFGDIAAILAFASPDNDNTFSVSAMLLAYQAWKDSESVTDFLTRSEIENGIEKIIDYVLEPSNSMQQKSAGTIVVIDPDNIEEWITVLDEMDYFENTEKKRKEELLNLLDDELEEARSNLHVCKRPRISL